MKSVGSRMRVTRWAVLFACVLAGASAHAQSSETKAAAEALFEEGRKAMDAGQYADACQRFEKSDELDPAPGTQLNLAACYEKLGRTASAWATYKRAAASARTRGQKDREKLALDGAAAIEPKLSRLSIVVPAESRSEGMQVKRNGQLVDSALYGQAVPVDPGTQNIEVTAPGKKPWSTKVDVAANGANQSVTVQALETDPNAAAPPTATAEPTAAPPPVAPTSEPIPPPAPGPDTSSNGSSQRTIGLIVGGAGIVSLGVGGLFALSAKSKYNDSKAFCLSTDVNKCTADGVALRDDARSAGNMATVFGGIGLAAVIGGTVLYFTAPSSSSHETARRTHPLMVDARASSQGGALTIGGIW